MSSNSLLYEINTRVWIKRFGQNKLLHEIPIAYWKELRAKGFEFIWLMGVWQINPNTIEKYCFEEGLLQEYTNALPDWKKEDVIGSPYSIEGYVVSQSLGGNESLLHLKEQLNSIGLKLILDFIPNHFSAESNLIEANPELFLQGTEEELNIDLKTYFKKNDRIFAHGKDPNFDAWQDTIQINYFNSSARRTMLDKLERISELCDGVRCDMAMLINNSIFANTWKYNSFLQRSKFPKNEFWLEAIQKLKRKKDFIFIAETYWDTEWILQQFGFDYTYDKRLLDRLKSESVNEIRSHLFADYSFQQKSIRFIENHDEQRAAKIFNLRKNKAAAIIAYTLPGLKLIYDGQFAGKQVRLPVQLGREPKEEINNDIYSFYNRLLEIIRNETFKNGNWKLLETLQAWEGNYSNNNFLAWLWEYNFDQKIVIVNYSDQTSQCRIKFDVPLENNEIKLVDLLNEVTYTRNVSEIQADGLYVELRAFLAHIFSIEKDS
ncbi:MAG: alpha-amylase family glycosyl hydrolase [Melioribacteraceae bacterium]|nr:alpha-amylase family glycosyl hydrolase [Melioribacteraceae bacterium]